MISPINATPNTPGLGSFELREDDDYDLIEHGIACNGGHTRMQNIMDMKGVVLP